MVCADGASLILATNLVATSADASSFAATILAMRDNIGLPPGVLAATEYASAAAVEALQAHAIEPLTAIGRTQPYCPHDFRLPARSKTPRRIKEPGASR